VIDRYQKMVSVCLSLAHEGKKKKKGSKLLQVPGLILFNLSLLVVAHQTIYGSKTFTTMFFYPMIFLSLGLH